MLLLLRFLHLSDCFGGTTCLRKLSVQHDNVPKQSFIKLVKNGRFDDINNILDHRHNKNNDNNQNHQLLLDVDRWLNEATTKYHVTATHTSNNTAGNNSNGAIRSCRAIVTRSCMHTFQANPTALHILVNYRPPLSTVKALVEILTITAVQEHVVSKMRHTTNNNSKKLTIQEQDEQPEIVTAASDQDHEHSSSK
jgi:hypothetical protein